MIFLSTVLATLLPVGYYIYIGFKKESRPDNLDDYFIYGKKVNASDFANTTVGYSLQMAALFLFADWGIRYGFGSFWVPIFWGVGFGLMLAVISRLSNFLTGDWTLHGYLKSVFDSRILQVTAAIATIIGLWGTMMVEIDYATSIYSPFFSESIGLYVLGMCFLAFGFLYISYGGYKAEVNTERIQVPVAYSALLGVILILVQNVYTRGYAGGYWALNAILLLCFILMILAKARLVPAKPFTDRQIFIPICGIVAQLILILISIHHGRETTVLLPFLSVDPWRQIRAQGALGLISLFFANALWQLVDISSWQRVLSVEVAPNDSVDKYLTIKRGLRRVMIESPVSWILGAILGMALKYGGFLKPDDDPSVALTNFSSALVSGKSGMAFLGNWTWLIYPLFAAAVIAVMLSTIDALISAIAFTSYHDLHFRGKKSLGSARKWTFCITAIGGGLYYAMRYCVKIDIPTILYAFYSSQLALFPVVIAALFLKKPSAYAAVSSVIIGILAALISAYLVANRPDLAVTPPLFALIASALIFGIVSLCSTKDLNSERDVGGKQ